MKSNDNDINDILEENEKSSLLCLWKAIVPKITNASNILFCTANNNGKKNDHFINRDSSQCIDVEKSIWSFDALARKSVSQENILINPSIFRDILHLDNDLTSILEDLHLTHDENGNLMIKLISRSEENFDIVTPRRSRSFCFQLSPKPSTMKNGSLQMMKSSRTEQMNLSPKKKNLTIKCGFLEHSPSGNMFHVFRHDSFNHIVPSLCSSSHCCQRRFFLDYSNRKPKRSASLRRTSNGNISRKSISQDSSPNKTSVRSPDRTIREKLQKKSYARDRKIEYERGRKGRENSEEKLGKKENQNESHENEENKGKKFKIKLENEREVKKMEKKKLESIELYDLMMYYEKEGTHRSKSAGSISSSRSDRCRSIDTPPCEKNNDNKKKKSISVECIRLMDFLPYGKCDDKTSKPLIHRRKKLFEWLKTPSYCESLNNMKKKPKFEEPITLIDPYKSADTQICKPCDKKKGPKPSFDECSCKREPCKENLKFADSREDWKSEKKESKEKKEKKVKEKKKIEKQKKVREREKKRRERNMLQDSVQSYEKETTQLSKSCESICSARRSIDTLPCREYAEKRGKKLKSDEQSRSIYSQSCKEYDNRRKNVCFDEGCPSKSSCITLQDPCRIIPQQQSQLTDNIQQKPPNSGPCKFRLLTHAGAIKRRKIRKSQEKTGTCTMDRIRPPRCQSFASNISDDETIPCSKISPMQPPLCTPEKQVIYPLPPGLLAVPYYPPLQIVEQQKPPQEDELQNPSELVEPQRPTREVKPQRLICDICKASLSKVPSSQKTPTSHQSRFSKFMSSLGNGGLHVRLASHRDHSGNTENDVLQETTKGNFLPSVDNTTELPKMNSKATEPLSPSSHYHPLISRPPTLIPECSPLHCAASSLRGPYPIPSPRGSFPYDSKLTCDLKCSPPDEPCTPSTCPNFEPCSMSRPSTIIPSGSNSDLPSPSIPRIRCSPCPSSSHPRKSRHQSLCRSAPCSPSPSQDGKSACNNEPRTPPICKSVNWVPPAASHPCSNSHCGFRPCSCSSFRPPKSVSLKEGSYELEPSNLDPCPTTFRRFVPCPFRSCVSKVCECEPGFLPPSRETISGSRKSIPKTEIRRSTSIFQPTPSPCPEERCKSCSPRISPRESYCEKGSCLPKPFLGLRYYDPCRLRSHPLRKKPSSCDSDCKVSKWACCTARRARCKEAFSLSKENRSKVEISEPNDCGSHAFPSKAVSRPETSPVYATTHYRSCVSPSSSSACSQTHCSNLQNPKSYCKILSSSSNESCVPRRSRHAVYRERKCGRPWWTPGSRSCSRSPSDSSFDDCRNPPQHWRVRSVNRKSRSPGFMNEYNCPISFMNRHHSRKHHPGHQCTADLRFRREFCPPSRTCLPTPCGRPCGHISCISPLNKSMSYNAPPHPAQYPPFCSSPPQPYPSRSAPSCFSPRCLPSEQSPIFCPRTQPISYPTPQPIHYPFQRSFLPGSYPYPTYPPPYLYCPISYPCSLSTSESVPSKVSMQLGPTGIRPPPPSCRLIPRKPPSSPSFLKKLKCTRNTPCSKKLPKSSKLKAIEKLRALRKFGAPGTSLGPQFPGISGQGQPFQMNPSVSPTSRICIPRYPNNPSSRCLNPQIGCPTYPHPQCYWPGSYPNPYAPLNFKAYRVSCEFGSPRHPPSRCSSTSSTSSSCTSQVTTSGSSSLTSSTSCSSYSTISSAISTPSYCVANYKNSSDNMFSRKCYSSCSVCNDFQQRQRRYEEDGRGYSNRKQYSYNNVESCEEIPTDRKLMYSSRQSNQRDTHIPPHSQRSRVCSSASNIKFDSTLRCKGISHYDDRIQFELQKIGIDQLIEASKPAKCCKQTVINQPTKKELPYTASLASLPLDRADIRVIRQSIHMATKKTCCSNCIANRTK